MITEISASTGISVDDILGCTRVHAVVIVRQLYYKVLREKKGFPFSWIGLLCYRDHSTIVSGLKHVNGLLEVGDKYTVQMWDRIKDMEA